MKIFLSFFQSAAEYPIPAYDFWQYYIKNGIEEAGHLWDECKDADWALGLVPKSKEEQKKWRDNTWETTVNWLKKHPADLFLSYLYPGQVDQSAIAEIKRLGIPCINFFCDHVREFKKTPLEFGVFDLNWVPEFKALAWYKNAGFPYTHLPMPAWVQTEDRVLRNETIHQVTFIGSKDIQRALLFEKVISGSPQLPLAIYGNGWNGETTRKGTSSPDYTFGKKLLFNLGVIKNQGVHAYLRKIRQKGIGSTIDNVLLSSKSAGILPFEQYNKLIADSAVTLGINRYPSFKFPIDKPDTYSRLRDIEAPMLGACYLTEWTEGIEEFYDTDKEIAVYRSVDELINKAQQLIRDGGKRQQLKKNGQKRALNDHTIPKSLEKIFKQLGLKN
jgi:hypothetical protein